MAPPSPKAGKCRSGGVGGRRRHLAKSVLGPLRWPVGGGPGEGVPSPSLLASGWPVGEVRRPPAYGRPFVASRWPVRGRGALFPKGGRPLLWPVGEAVAKGGQSAKGRLPGGAVSGAPRLAREWLPAVCGQSGVWPKVASEVLALLAREWLPVVCGARFGHRPASPSGAGGVAPVGCGQWPVSGQ